MSKYSLAGEYRRNRLQGTNITLDRWIRKRIEKYGISELYLFTGEIKKYGKHFRFIDAFPEPPPESIVGKTTVSEIKEGKIQIPKDMIDYAELERGKVCVIGMQNYLEIWNCEKLEKFTSYKIKITKKEIEEVRKIAVDKINNLVHILRRK